MLQAIIGMSEGRPLGDVMDDLYAQIGRLEQDLANNKDALNWFDIATAAPIPSTPAPSEVSSTPLPGTPFFIRFNPPSNDDTEIPNIHPPPKDVTVIPNTLPGTFKG